MVALSREGSSPRNAAEIDAFHPHDARSALQRELYSLVDHPHHGRGRRPQYHPHAEAERRVLLADHDDDAPDERNHPHCARFERCER